MSSTEQQEKPCSGSSSGSNDVALMLPPIAPVNPPPPPPPKHRISFTGLEVSETNYATSSNNRQQQSRGSSHNTIPDDSIDIADFLIMSDEENLAGYNSSTNRLLSDDSLDDVEEEDVEDSQRTDYSPILDYSMSKILNDNDDDDDEDELSESSADGDVEEDYEEEGGDERKSKKSILAIGKSKFKSLSKKKKRVSGGARIVTKTPLKEPGGGDSGGGGGGKQPDIVVKSSSASKMEGVGTTSSTTTAEGTLDSSWRANLVRRSDRKQQGVLPPVDSPAAVQTPGGSMNKDQQSSILRYIRSWGRDKTSSDHTPEPPRSWGREKEIILDNSSTNKAENTNAMPSPPSLGVTRVHSGPLSTSLSEIGKAISSPLTVMSIGRQRSSPTDRQKTSPPTTHRQISNPSSPQQAPSPASFIEKETSLKQQLLSQIRQQRVNAKSPPAGNYDPDGSSPKLNDNSWGDDNNSAGVGPDVDDDGIALLGGDAEGSSSDEDSSIDSWDVSDDEPSIDEIINWNSMPALPNRFCEPPPRTTHHQQQKQQQQQQPFLTPSNLTVSSPAVVAGSSLDATNSFALISTTTGSTTLSPSYGAPNYLDAGALTRKITRHEANRFVQEHEVLLQAVLQLLAERDQVGVEGSMDSADNIWKKGPLKKLTFAALMGVRRKPTKQRPVAGGVWKVKYVELRHGNLCYYEDSGNDTSRKTIHLRQADTVIKDSLHYENKWGQQQHGYCFELLVQGSPSSIWMASSEEERQSWVRAIKSAMIGEDATTNNSPRKSLDLTPYKESLTAYSNLREALQSATNQTSYLAAIHAAMKEVALLQVPVEWVREKIEQDLSPLLLGTLKPPKFNRSPQKALKYSITEFWRNMKETTFSINGLRVPRQTQLASERVVGALTRAILEFDKSFLETHSKQNEDDPGKSQISELQAVSYARNILLAILRSKERQDAAYAAKYLLENPGLVVLESKHPDHHQGSISGSIDELVYIEVSSAGADLSDDFLPDSEEMSGWVWTRTRRRHPAPLSVPTSISRKPRYTFAVLSGAMLSYYEASSPRPHGLRGQFALVSESTVRDEGPEQITEPTTNKGGEINSENNAKIRYVLCISTPGHQDRLLGIENQADVAAWKEAIQNAIDSAGSLKSSPPRVVTTTTTIATLPGKMLVKGAEKAIMVAEAGTMQGIRAIKGAKDMGMRAIKTSTDGGIKVIRGAVGMLRPGSKNESTDEGSKGRRKLLEMTKRPSMQMLLSNTIVHGKREPSVQCVLQTMQTFSIRDPNSTEHNTDHSTERDSSHRSNNTEGGFMSVQAKIYQAFLMSGGPSGRIARGVPLVEVDFVETSVEDEEEEDIIEDMLEMSAEESNNLNPSNAGEEKMKPDQHEQYVK